MKLENVNVTSKFSGKQHMHVRLAVMTGDVTDRVIQKEKDGLSGKPWT